MPEIINPKTRQINVTLVSNSSINIESITDADFKNQVIDAYGTEAKPSVSRFPDMVLLFDPTFQLSINIFINEKRVIIGDNRITNYSERNLDEFARVVSGINDVIFKGREDPLLAYGINVTFVAELSVEEDSAVFLKDHFFQPSRLEGKVYGSGIRIISEEETHKNDLRIDPRLGNNLIPTKAIVVGQNSHFSDNKLPTPSEIKNQITDIYGEIPNRLDALINSS